MPRAKRPKLTKREQYNVSRALRRLNRELDRFETSCVKNNRRVRRITYLNAPDAEWSEFEVEWRR